jgi:hypothetical protein
MGAFNANTAAAVFNNTVIINDAVSGRVNGGDLWYTGATRADVAVYKNSVTLNAGASIGNNSYGGNAQNTSGGLAATTNDSTTDAVGSGNSITVAGAAAGAVMGGLAYSSGGNEDASGNSASMSAGSVLYIYGGYAADYHDDVFSAQAINNRVTVSGGTVSNYVEGAYVGVSSPIGTALARGNQVTVNGNAVVSDWVIGGYAEASYVAAAALLNSVSLEDTAEVAGITGGQVRTDSGSVGAGSPYVSGLGNTVNISGGKVDADVIGGYAEAVAGGTASAADNIVNISGGEVDGGIYGAQAPTAATNNTVNISGTPTLGTLLYGGFAPTSTGNTLNYSSVGLTVLGEGTPADNGLAWFQNLNFNLPPAAASGGPALLNVVNTADIANAKISVGLIGGGPTGGLAPGQTYTLLHAGALSAAGITPTPPGVIGGYNYTLSVVPAAAATDLVLTIGPRVATQAPTVGTVGLLLLALALAGLASLGLLRRRA